DLALQLRYPEVVDDIGRSKVDFDLLSHRDVNFVGGVEALLLIVGLPPPLMADDIDRELRRRWVRDGDQIARRKKEDEGEDDRRDGNAADPEQRCAERVPSRLLLVAGHAQRAD